MIELSKMRMFTLLSESSQVTNEEMQNAYGDFVEYVETINSENDYSKIYRNLSIARIELSALEPIYRYEQGKKCPEINLSAKSFILS